MACSALATPRAFAIRPVTARRTDSKHKTRCTRRFSVRASASSDSDDGIVPKGSTVLVVGATGGVGQLVVAKLLEQGYSVRAACRNKTRAAETFGTFASKGNQDLEIVAADLRNLEELKASEICKDVDAVVSCIGTTAFPSARWKQNNGPEQTDFVSVKNLVEAVGKQSDKKCKRVILVSSVGVDRTDRMPFLILNLFGVLKNKKKGEDEVKTCNTPYTILRPGRLTDGPYTSYDINTLVKATSGERRAVVVEFGDALLPEETSRIVVADAAVASLQSKASIGGEYCLSTTEGDGPGNDQSKWDSIFANANR